jgi:hypothetical protein
MTCTLGTTFGNVAVEDPGVELEPSAVARASDWICFVSQHNVITNHPTQAYLPVS